MADDSLFRIDGDPVFTVPVTITGAGGVGKRLQITYRHKSRSQFRAWMESVRAADESAVPDILMEIVADWSDADAPFSREALTRLLDNYYLAKDELLLAYVDGLHGERLKN